MQDSFIALWRGAGDFASARGNVRNWLLSILHNRGVDRLRSLGAISRRQEALEQVALRSPDEPDAAERGIDRVLGETIRAELAGLPVEQQEILTLAYYRGLTHLEIADLLRVPPGTVTSRMRLGLMRLRRGLGVVEVSS